MPKPILIGGPDCADAVATNANVAAEANAALATHAKDLCLASRFMSFLPVLTLAFIIQRFLL
jgi:hypothetical protein